MNSDIIPLHNFPTTLMSTFTSSSSLPLPLLSVPPEIHGMILSYLTTNDLICLRLTCKPLYTSLTATPLPLTNSDTTSPAAFYPLCCPPISSTGILATPLAHNVFHHLPHCHATSHAEATRRALLQGRRPPAPLRPKCRTSRWALHCACFVRNQKLYQRLRGWVPRGWVYCAGCELFTQRRKGKRGHGAKCHHGRPKRRRSTRKFWTYYSHKGGFGQYRTRMWKKWFNNQSMNRFEARLMRGSSGGGGGGQLERAPALRADHERYGFRELAPKAVDTRKMRYVGFP